MQKSIIFRYMYMKYITTSPQQQISIIPRKTILPQGEYEIYCYIKDETTKQIYSVSIKDIYFESDLFYITLDGMEFLKENIFYEVRFSDSINKIVYKDRYFCTDQDKNTYSVNAGAYNLPDIDNNYYITI